MSKIKKMILGIALAMCVFGGSVGSCYAAANQISVEVNASRVVGKFVCGEAGHQIKVTAYDQEVNSFGFTVNGNCSDTQFGNVTTAYVSRSNSDGYQYVWAYSVGFVDGAAVAASGVAYA